MRLYKEYREEQQLEEQEKKDREEAMLPEQVAIIYEKDTALSMLGRWAKAACAALLFTALLTAIGGAAIFLLSLPWLKEIFQ